MSARKCDACGGSGRSADAGSFIPCEECKGHGTIFDWGVSPEEVQAEGYPEGLAAIIAAKWPQRKPKWKRGGGGGESSTDDPPPNPGGGVPKPEGN